METPARRRATVDDLERAGDYCSEPVTVDGASVRSVWFLLPCHEGETRFDRPTRGSGLHRIGEDQGWTITEWPDGSVSAQPSIACGRHDPEGEYWHGYLQPGDVWLTL